MEIPTLVGRWPGEFGIMVILRELFTVSQQHHINIGSPLNSPVPHFTSANRDPVI